MISGTVSESATTWASVRVDVQRDPDDDGAVVVGPRQGRGDRHETQRRALERAGEVDPADGVEGMAAGARGDVAWSRSRCSPGSSAARCSERPGLPRGGGDRRLRGSSVIPGRFPVRPGGIVKLSLPRNWSPSSRSSFSVKEL